MSGNFARYMHAQEKRRGAYSEYNYAGVNLTLAQIRERLAEIRSQHEPLESESEGDKLIRVKMIRAAFYVVVGRWPTEEDVS